jgi:hypothetical protein
VAALLTVLEARDTLNLQDGGDDTLLTELVDGMTAVIEHRVGAVTPREIDVKLRECGRAVVLSEPNVIELVSASTPAGAFPITGLDLSDSGIVRGSMPSGAWTLRIRVGMDPVPPAIKNAAREVLRDAYDFRRQNADARSVPYAISYRAMAWLEPYLTAPGTA